jgi:hypothetical protein
MKGPRMEDRGVRHENMRENNSKRYWQGKDRASVTNKETFQGRVRNVEASVVEKIKTTPIGFDYNQIRS